MTFCRIIMPVPIYIYINDCVNNLTFLFLVINRCIVIICVQEVLVKMCLYKISKILNVQYEIKKN